MSRAFPPGLKKGRPGNRRFRGKGTDGAWPAGREIPDMGLENCGRLQKSPGDGMPMDRGSKGGTICAPGKRIAAGPAGAGGMRNDRGTRGRKGPAMPGGKERT